MSSSSRRVSQTPIPNVNLFCTQCDTQIGVFANEWTRLTSTYVYAAHVGKHFGTEVANKTQVVPNGVLQKAVEGCTTAEVFCKNCSAGVGQYCKAAPTAEQRRLIDQYFYKLSKTYLKDNETNTIVDPIFAFSGNIVRNTSRLSVAPRQSLPSLPRWSQTPMRSDDMPSTSRSFSESQSQFHQPSPLQNTSYPEPPTDLHLEAHETRLKAQDDKIAAQGQTLRQQDTQIRLLTTLLETLQSTVEDLKKSMREMKSQKTAARSDTWQNDPVTEDTGSMLRDKRQPQTSTADIERLRVENNVMKARLEDLESATGGSTGSQNTTSMLGKRKRHEDNTRPGASRFRGSTSHDSPSFHGASSFIQMPTPRSSNPSDSQSQGASSPSRDLTPEELSDVTQQHLSQANDKAKQNLELLADSVLQEGEGDNSIQGSEDAPDDKETAPSSAGDESAISAVEHLLGTEQSEDSILPASTPIMDVEPSFDNGDDDKNIDAPQPDSNMDMRTEHETARAGPAHFTSISSSPADNVEFSDEEQEQVFNQRNNDDNETVNVRTVAGKEPLQQPEPRTRRQTRRSSAAVRVAETTKNGRYAAPEPSTFARVIPRRLEKDGFARVATPTSVEAALRGHKPKALQPVTQILFKELDELGLQEWKHKDRKCAEYRKIVSEARKRKREENKLAKLVNSGTGVDVVAATVGREDLPNPSDLIQRSIVSLDDAFQAATAALLDGSTGQLKATGTVPFPGHTTFKVRDSNDQPTVNEGMIESVSSEETMSTRRRQREAEIRRRDQLAMEAMDMSD
ncbi:hypothetical protein PV11_09009 [Exophiala sideris]|uniref:Yippee domain-containing protein n=1 Tax=Exophiala sideris TaxID=1016849 RepID=A0A0D1Y2Q9_9EURO|nr:hypothetical protein PV11_09009 [Exophiala sideris]